MDVNDDPQYGGYAMAMIGAQGAAGIGGKQDPNMPDSWSLYIGTDDIHALAQKIKNEGGKVIAAPFDVGDQGKMAVFQDPGGAFISAWQGQQMNSFVWDVPNAFGWSELSARGVQDVVPFYERVFGWTKRLSDMAPDQPPYTEFQKDGESILGAWEMNEKMPAQVPSYWQIYFNVGALTPRPKRRGHSVRRKWCRRRTSRAADSRSWSTRRAPHSHSFEPATASKPETRGMTPQI